MKKLLLFLISLGVFLSIPFPVNAVSSPDWTISNYTSAIAIQDNGTVLVTESIETQFSIPKHGIYRDIPYEYKDQKGQKTYVTINLHSVTQDGKPVPKALLTENGYLRIKIGDPDKTISGPVHYALSYQVTGVLRSLSDHDDFYWNATGNDWDTTIEKASATVSLPKGKITAFHCYEGYPGSTTPCQKQQRDSILAQFVATRTLESGEGLTVQISYPKGELPILIGKPPKRLETEILAPVSLITFVVSLLCGILAITRLWLSRGRDFWYRTPSTLDPQATAEIRPTLGHETTVVEFEPPQKLRPAEIGVLMDERADTLDVTATIIDLASRGYLTITEEPKTWLFGNTDYILKQQKEPDSVLLSYEKMLLDRLFTTGNTVKMSELKLQFYKDLADIKSELYANVTEKKLFAGNPEKTRLKYLGIGVLVAVLGGFVIYIAAQFILGPLATAGGGIIISGIILLAAANIMPQRTALGHELWRRSKGYYLFISGAEKYRQKFFEKKNMFNDILPYAIVFKLTDKYAKAMKELGIEPTQPTWYTGSQPFNTGYFVSSVNNFSSSMSRAIAQTPSSSGSGSSGGGFGGGGGGSW